MNLLLLEQSDFRGPNAAEIDSRRLAGLVERRALKVGDAIRVGLIDGKLGSASITGLKHPLVRLHVHLDAPPPAPLPVTLVIALPRPKMIKRLLQTCATMGVKRLVFINSYRVEKSYWKSPQLTEHAIREQLFTGLQQGIDTVLPEVTLEKLFKPFAEDRLPGLCEGRRALVAHPGSAAPCPASSAVDTLLVVGPEGGFIDYEIAKLTAAGCGAVNLGPRILRTETAVPVLLAKLFP